MAKQEAAEAFPQQLSLDLEANKLASGRGEDVVNISNFVDSATLHIRKLAVQRVLDAGIFALPVGRVK